jgi:hypothetical protein
MSAGAVFKLIANDGKADRMIMATKLLNQRIKDVMCARSRANKADITPTLVDLERTHILYINAHFKPFAAVGYEYNKVRPQSGSVTSGQGVTFSIPQFGDFFHDMIAHLRYKKFAWPSQSTPLQAAGSVFPLNVVGVMPTPSNAADITVEGTASRFYSLVDAQGTELVRGGVTANPAQVAFRNLARYCEFPGNKAFKLVKFDVNGNPLDQYSQNIPLMLEKFCVMPNKRVGYDRLVGQEVPLIGYGAVRSNAATDANSSATPAGISLPTGLFNSNAPGGIVGGVTTASPSVLLGNGAGQQDFSRERKQFVNGPQTPKPEQPALDIWNKLRFWFNDDVRLSIASVSIPFGQRFISIDLENASELIHEVPNLFLRETSVLVSAYNYGVGSSAGKSNIVHTTTTNVKYTPIPRYTPGDVSLEIDVMELFINNIFVNPEVHDIFIKRIGFSLIRVYREMTIRSNVDSGDEKLLSQIKWPVEYMMVGLRPSWNINSSNANKWRDWHRLTRQLDVTVNNTMAVVDAELRGNEIINNATASGTGAGLSVTYIGLPKTTTVPSPGTFNSLTTDPVMKDQYWVPVPTCDTMSLTSHGIPIFDAFDDVFFNAYMPYHYGGTALSTPEDSGALFLNFCLFPRAYQPSAHLNISRARETYLKWTTSYISSTTAADCIAVAVAINFLLLTDGSAVLRYST